MVPKIRGERNEIKNENIASERRKKKGTINIRLFGLENKSFFAIHFYMLAFIRFVHIICEECVCVCVCESAREKKMCKMYLIYKKKNAKERAEATATSTNESHGKQSPSLAHNNTHTNSHLLAYENNVIFYFLYFAAFIVSQLCTGIYVYRVVVATADAVAAFALSPLTLAVSCT